MKDLVIFGTGGFAREVHQVVRDINREAPTWNTVGFLDGNTETHGTIIHGLPVLGGADWLGTHPETWVVLGIGSPTAKRRVVRQILDAQGGRFGTLVHPKSWIGENVSIGPGTIVCAGVCITTDVVIASHVVLNLAATVGHDAMIDDYVTILPSVNVSGNVHIEEGCDVGTGSQIIQGLQLGRWSIVGAGSVVVKSVPPNVTAVGAPAKVIKERFEGWHEGS